MLSTVYWSDWIDDLYARKSGVLALCQGKEVHQNMAVQSDVADISYPSGSPLRLALYCILLYCIQVFI